MTEPKTRILSLATLLLLIFVALGSAASSPSVAADTSCTTADTAAQPISASHRIPPYPTISLLNGEQGLTTLNLTIGPAGAPTFAGIDKSSGWDRLDAAAAQVVRETWRWIPATRNCKPVSTTTKVNIAWSLPPNMSYSALGLNVLIPSTTDYPVDAQSRGERGITMLSLAVPKGSQKDDTIMFGSGFADLDDKALELAKAHDWTNGRVDPALGSLRVYVIWKLPADAAAK